MAFDLNDNYTFYHYTIDNEDIGTYSKISDTEYIINTPNLNNVQINYDSNHLSFEITLGSVSYKFTQMSHLPILNLPKENIK